MSEVTALASWEAYVDTFDEKHVHLVMADTDSDNDNIQEYGEFPIRHFDGIELVQGLLLTVKVLSNETIEIKTIKPRPPRIDEENVAALLSELG